MKKLLFLLITILVVILVFPSMVSACGFCAKDNAPPELTEEQATRWVNAHPIARVYLARLYDIPQYEAERFGAEYKLPICGLSDSQNYGTNPLPPPSSYPTDYSQGAGWNREVKYIDTYIPIPIDYTIPLEPSVMPQIDYVAPPSLSEVERVRWGQSLPTTRPYLAKLWGIDREIAEQYGAKYQ